MIAAGAGARILRVLVVDDEPLARRGIRALIDTMPGSCEVREAAGGEQAIRMITEQRPDLVFLDVQMPRVDGFGVVEAVGAEHMPPVVFVTAYDAHALRAFEAQAVDYLLKPVDPARFRDAFDRACRAGAGDEIAELRRAIAELTQIVRRRGDTGTPLPSPKAAGDRRLRVRHEGRVVLVDPREIDWIEAVGNYVVLHARGSRLRHRATLTEMQDLLGDAFIRIRRSTLVRAAAVRYCEPYGKSTYTIVLHDQTRLTSSRFYRRDLAPLLGE